MFKELFQNCNLTSKLFKQLNRLTVSTLVSITVALRKKTFVTHFHTLLRDRIELAKLRILDCCIPRAQQLHYITYLHSISLMQQKLFAVIVKKWTSKWHRDYHFALNKWVMCNIKEKICKPFNIAHFFSLCLPHATPFCDAQHFYILFYFLAFLLYSLSFACNVAVKRSALELYLMSLLPQEQKAKARKKLQCHI